jgi:FkbM family methyltransferase
MDEHSYTTPSAGPYQSQHGEDAWLARYFGGKRTGFFVEVGAYDGIVLSNTYYFEQLGWTGVLVEPHPTKAAACRGNRPGSRVFECAAVSAASVASIEMLDVPGGEVYSTTVASDFNLQRLRDYGLESRTIVVPGRTLDSILEEMQPPAIDFMSIDVEGAEIEVLKGFDIGRWRPRLVMIESPPRRLDAIRRYFVSNGYAYLRSININDIYEALPATLPGRERPGVAAAIDGARYVVRKTLTAVRTKVRLRTRLRASGLWP